MTSRKTAKSRTTRRAGLAARAATVAFGLGLAAAPSIASAQQMVEVGGEPTRSAGVVDLRRDGLPDYHSVEKGDTLWGLAGRYYGDFAEWPRLWSYNPHITNPHWIYPGDIIYLKPEPTGEEKKMQKRSEEGPKVVQQSQYDPSQLRLYMPVGGFALAVEDIGIVGRIAGAPKEARMLGEYDTAYVGFGYDAYTEQERDELDSDELAPLTDPGEVRKGDIFAIIRLVGPVLNEDGNKVGDKYWVLGSLQVTELNDNYLEKAKILQSWSEIERGDLLVRYEQQLKKVSPREASKKMVARIVDSLKPRSILGEFHYVLVDRGAKDDVRVGHRFFAYQRGDGTLRPNEEPQKETPYERVGQVIVVEVREYYSTAVVINSKKELEQGDRLEMYPGY